MSKGKGKPYRKEPLDDYPRFGVLVTYFDRELTTFIHGWASSRTAAERMARNTRRRDMPDKVEIVELLERRYRESM